MSQEQCTRSSNGIGHGVYPQPVAVIRRSISNPMCKTKLCDHYSCEDFYHMFCGLRAELATMHQAKSSQKETAWNTCHKLFKAASLSRSCARFERNSEHIRVGKTRVFVRTDETMQHLLRIATQLKKSSATKIQAIVRMFLARNLLFHQAMVWCHLDPAVDWQRELMLMREEDVRSALESKAFALALWNSEEEVTKRRWNEERNASINREVAYIQEQERRQEDERHQHVLGMKRARAHRRAMTIRLQSLVRGMLSRRQTQCWIQCNSLARASRRGAEDLEGFEQACETLLFWRGGTHRPREWSIWSKEIAAAKNVEVTKRST